MPIDLNTIQETFSRTKSGRILMAINGALHLTEFLSWPLTFVLGSIGIHNLTELPKNVRSLGIGLGFLGAAVLVFIGGMVAAGERERVLWEVDQRLSAILQGDASTDKDVSDNLTWS